MRSVTMRTLLLAVSSSLFPAFAVRAEDAADPAKIYQERKLVYTGGDYKDRE